jgi:lipopolysaccharide transport system ATP-binding protein
MDSAVRVTGVGKSFRRYHADRPGTIQETIAKGLAGWRRLRQVELFWGLRDVNFEVPRGRAVGIVGANGSGKSTLLRLIGGVGRPDEGSIETHGRLGALLDLGAGFHPDLTGRENAMLAGILNGLTRAETLAQLDDIVAFAEVEDVLDNPIRTYSTGMQMRLAFAVAAHTQPDILLIDEVLAVGDAAFQKKCLDRIRQFRRNGCTILLVSHVGAQLRDFCEDAIWLEHGRVKAQGPAGEILTQYEGP